MSVDREEEGNGGEKRGNARLRMMAKRERERENKRCGDRNKRRIEGGEVREESIKAWWSVTSSDKLWSERSSGK